MPTAAYSAAKTNLQRASYFLDIHQGTQQGPGTPNNKRRELPRGAVVFAVGALDAYLSQVAGEVMVAQFTAGGGNGDNRKVLEAVLKVQPTLAIELAIAPNTVDRMEVVRQAITDYFSNQISNHGSKAVAATVQRMGGAPTAVWARTVALGQANAAAELDTWTDRRHAIVHRGEAPTVNREPARACVKLITDIVLAVDEIALVSMA